MGHRRQGEPIVGDRGVVRYVVDAARYCSLAKRHPELRIWGDRGSLYLVLTETPAQHPWAKYYAERGLARPPVADMPGQSGRARVRSAGAAARTTARKPAEISSELAAAVAAVNAQAAQPGYTAAPFITAMQREVVGREFQRRATLKFARIAGIVAVVVALLHVTVTRLIYAAPSEAALQTQVNRLPEALLPHFSTSRQPLQADGVVITQTDQIDARNFRYVASVTLRLRKPLYIGAVSNGTAQYRRLQQVLSTARDQELRFSLFSGGDAPEVPTLPLLLQQSHRVGEAIVVRVPFTARRFGWQWRIDAPQIALAIANRTFDGDSIERYAGLPHLIYGSPASLADIRRRVKAANNYVQSVAKTVQGQANVEAVAVTPVADSSLADQPALPAAIAALADVEALPAFDPHAPAVEVEEAPKVGGFLNRG